MRQSCNTVIPFGTNQGMRVEGQNDPRIQPQVIQIHHVPDRIASSRSERLVLELLRQGQPQPEGSVSTLECWVEE